MDRPIENKSVSEPSIKEAFLVWLKIGVLSFGGPAAQIALMHRLVVAEKRWLSEKQYLNALSFCMLLPGPEAMQLATYAGWRLHGTLGGLIAGLLFVLPGACVIAVLAWIYVLYGDMNIVNNLFIGVKAAVIVVVLEALHRVSRKSLISTAHWVIAFLSFIGIFFLDISYPLIILMAALYGYFKESAVGNTAISSMPNRKSAVATLKTIVFCCLVWVFPIVLVALFSDQELLLQIGSFFSRLAVVTFGGAYAVLAYLGQEVVSEYGWLDAGEMMDGLGLAETTPGPLILVVEFVGFIAGFREGGPALGVAAALLTLWVTFVPCFLWIFAGAPYLEWICDQPGLKGALSAITAAVVGVILNLSVWFALHVLFGSITSTNYGPIKLWLPNIFTIDWKVVLLTILCALAAFRLHWSILRILLASSLLGLFLSSVF